MIWWSPTAAAVPCARAENMADPSIVYIRFTIHACNIPTNAASTYIDIWYYNNNSNNNSLMPTNIRARSIRPPTYHTHYIILYFNELYGILCRYIINYCGIPMIHTTSVLKITNLHYNVRLDQYRLQRIFALPTKCIDNNIRITHRNIIAVDLRYRVRGRWWHIKNVFSTRNAYFSQNCGMNNI